MVTLFISALAIVFIIGIGFYFLLRSTAESGERVLPPNPGFHGLFGEDPAHSQAEKKKIAFAACETEALSLLDRARRGDVSALADANHNGEPAVYDQVLDELVAQAGGNAGLLSLMSYVAQNELRVNRTLATAVVVSWKESPDRGGTAKALHFAALSDDADVYREAVESALQFWRAGKLSDISAAELRALFDGEFWILSSRTRSSGAGFVLKRTLDKARRELETASIRSPSLSEGNSPNEALPDGRASDTNS
jgi:hypothetical protein